MREKKEKEGQRPAAPQYKELISARVCRAIT